MPHPEILEALAEFTERFGEAVVKDSIEESGICANSSDPLSMLRAFAVLILDSPQPHLVATIVARLTGLDEAVGKTKTMSDLAREFGRTKQSISERQRLIAAQLNLPNNTVSQKTRESLRLHSRTPANCLFNQQHAING